jgi:hypothetical protein
MVANSEEKLTLPKHKDRTIPLLLSKILHTGDLLSTTNSNNLDSSQNHLDNPIRKEKMLACASKGERVQILRIIRKCLNNKIQTLIF